MMPSRIHDIMSLPRYKQLLTYIKSAVTRNHSEKSINSILDYISTSKQVRLEICMKDSQNFTRNDMFFLHLLFFRWSCCRTSMRQRWTH